MAKILITDDSAFMRRLIRDTLQKHGYMDIIEAKDGIEACEKFVSENPDLIIMDITMPNMTGLEALAEIKKNNPKAIIIMCSAMGQELMVVDAINLGAVDFIVKPFKPGRLIQVVKKFLG